MNLTLSTLPPTLKTWLKLVTAVLMGLMMLWSAHLWNLSTTSVDSGVQDQKPITVLHAAEFNTTTQPGPAGPRFESVQLPHRLGNQHNAYMHYRVLLPTDAHTGDAHSLSLCVPRWSARPVVWLDGQKLLDHANSHLAVTALQRPTYLALPPLSPDKSHWLDIQLRAVPGTFPGLSEIWLGDDRAVNTACHAMVENNSGARIGSLYLMIFLTLMSAGVTLYQRENLARGFAVLGFLWCLYAMIALGWIPFLNDEVWLACMHLTRPLPGLAAIWFVQRLINQKFRLINRLLVVMAVLAYAIFPFLPQEQWNFWLIVVGSCLDSHCLDQAHLVCSQIRLPVRFHFHGHHVFWHWRQCDRHCPQPEFFAFRHHVFDPSARSCTGDCDWFCGLGATPGILAGAGTIGTFDGTKTA